MDQTKIGWIAFAVALFVYLDLLFVELRRMGREGRRIVTRVMAYADLPVVAQAARAGDDAEQLGRALEAVTPLLERGSVALATIRRAGRPAAYEPFVPNGSDASNGFSVD
jgi:hypothetical protein